MKKKESKETSPALKSTSDKPTKNDSVSKKEKVSKKESGGHREGAGRKPLGYEITRVEIKMPTTLYNDINELRGKTNLSAYINTLAEKDVKRMKKNRDRQDLRE